MTVGQIRPDHHAGRNRPYRIRLVSPLSRPAAPSLADHVGTGAPRNVSDRRTPEKNGKWRVSRLSLQTSGPAPVSKRQAGELTEEETLIEIRKILGNKAPMLARNAPWRLKQASESQINTIKRLFRNRPDEQPIVKLAGEASDAIAHERFRRRVNPRLL